MPEDLAHTPAERAAAAAAADQEGKKPTTQDSYEERLAAFAAAPEVTVGASEDGQQHMVVLGAGLVGSLLAVVLLRKGYKVDVYERYPDIRGIPSTGRSINLSVTSRGLRAIRALGGNLYEDFLGLATRVRGRIIHLQTGKVFFQRYGRDDTECNYSVSRVELNKFLINVAAKEGAVFHFDHNLSETSDFSSDDLVGCTLHFTQGPPSKPDEQTRVRVQVRCPVIACDGGGSRVRYALRSQGFTEFSEDILDQGYKEVLFPHPGENDFGAKGEDGGEACTGRYGLHIWPRKNHMLMALSNVDGSFTGTIYMPNKGPAPSFEAFSDTPEGRARCKDFCEEFYAEALPHVGGIDKMMEQVTKNPTGILGTVFTTRWAIKGKVLMIGDAVHAMVPFFGQGCNCGFEDVFWLSRFLDQHCGDDGRCTPEKCTGANFAAVFEALEKERQPNGTAICNMALENYVEMQDKTADLKFQTMKKLENKIENAFPNKFRSRYAMVCYGGEGNVSYDNAKRLGLVQAALLEQLCAGMADLSSEEAQKAEVEKVDLSQAERLIDQDLLPLQKELGIDLSTVRH